MIIGNSPNPPKVPPDCPFPLWAKSGIGSVDLLDRWGRPRSVSRARNRLVPKANVGVAPADAFTLIAVDRCVALSL